MVSSKQSRVPAAAAGANENWTGKRGRTRRSMLDSTFRLIGHEHGLNVRIEEICADAGVSRGTFYNYFASLDELFQTLALDLSHDFNHAVLATLATIESRAERTNAAIQHYLKRARRDPAWGWAMVHLSATGPFFGRKSYDACGKTLSEGIKAGEFDLPSMQLGRDMVMGTILAAMITILRDEGRARSHPRHVAHYLLRALGVPDARAHAIAESSLPDVLAVRQAE